MRWHLKPAVMWESWFHSLMRLLYYWGTSKFQSLFWGKSTKSLVTHLVLCNFGAILIQYISICIKFNPVIYFAGLIQLCAISRDLVTYSFAHVKLYVRQQCVFRNGRHDAHVPSIVPSQTVNPDITFPFFPSLQFFSKYADVFVHECFLSRRSKRTLGLRNFIEPRLLC